MCVPSSLAVLHLAMFPLYTVVPVRHCLRSGRTACLVLESVLFAIESHSGHSVIS